MKQRIQKLLAVITFVGAASTSALAAPRMLANGAPAPGNTITKPPPTSLSRAKHKLVFTREVLVAALAEEKEAAASMAIQPRVLANGAPACGNTHSKNEMECTTTRSDQQWKQRVQRLVQAGVAVRAAQASVASAKKAYASFGSAADRKLLAMGGDS